MDFRAPPQYAVPVDARGTNPIILDLRLRRLEARFTQEHIAAVSGYSVSAIRSVELGRQNPSLNLVIDYASIFGLELRLCESSAPTKPTSTP